SWTLAAGLFPSEYPDLSKNTYWWMGIAGALGLFLSIILHEFSHSVVARRFGMPIRGITLFIFGGVAEMEEEPPSAESEFWMAIAGPIASFVLSMAFYLLYAASASLELPVFFIGVTHYLSNINFILAVFNLVPAFPLDGGRVLRAAIWKWKNNLIYATWISSRIGSGFGWLLIILGVVGFFQGNFIGGMWWLLIGTFVRGTAVASYSFLIAHEVLSDQPVRKFMKAEPVSAPPSITVRQLVDDYFYRHYHLMIPVIEDGRLLGCVTLQAIKELPVDEWESCKTGDIMAYCSPENTVAPNADSAKVFKSMLRPGASTQLMVVDGDRLLGVVSLTDFREYLSMKMDLEPPA
ncbi:MAG: site-2 protease family protein, partial [Gammaproteobacteria bacterium]